MDSLGFTLKKVELTRLVVAWPTGDHLGGDGDPLGAGLGGQGQTNLGFGRRNRRKIERDRGNIFLGGGGGVGKILGLTLLS